VLMVNGVGYETELSNEDIVINFLPINHDDRVIGL